MDYDATLQNELEILKMGTEEDKIIKACNYVSDYFTSTIL